MSTSVYDELLAIDLHDIIYGYITEKDVSIFHGLIKEHAPPGNRLLDLCCGTGAHLRAYQKLGYHVAGVDLSQAMLDRARRTLGAVTLDHGDMKTFQSAEKFDIVTCHSLSILHNTSSADLLKTFSNLFTMLRPSGILIFDALSKDDGAGPPYRAGRDPMAQIVIDPDSALFSRYGDELGADSCSPQSSTGASDMLAHGALQLLSSQPRRKPIGRAPPRFSRWWPARLVG
jgi:SAM-dependent methyltransferase